MTRHAYVELPHLLLDDGASLQPVHPSGKMFDSAPVLLSPFVLLQRHPFITVRLADVTAHNIWMETCVSDDEEDNNDPPKKRRRKDCCPLLVRYYTRCFGKNLVLL